MKSPPPFVRSRDAFTVIEIMIAMTILTMCMLSTMGLMKWVVRGTDYSGRLTTATTYAQDKLEQLSRSNYSAVASGSDTVNGYSRSWTVVDAGDYKSLSLSTTFTAIDGSTKLVFLQEILAP